MNDRAGRGYEATDVSVKIASASLVGILVVTAIAAGVALVLILMFGPYDQQPSAELFRTSVLAPSAPRLESAPGKDRKAVETRARALLSNYAWNDRRAGLARIPIEQAMALQAKRGWPDAAETPP